MAYFNFLFLVYGLLQILILMAMMTTCVTDIINLNNYGPYTLDFEQFEYCAGPKSKNITYSYIDVVKLKEGYVANINVTFFTQCHIDELKIRKFAVGKDQKTLMFSYKIDQPCQHYAFATLIDKYFGANRCVVKKGHYIFKLNLDNITRIFYGKSSFYGKFQTKSIATTKQGNVLCWIMNNEFKK